MKKKRKVKQMIENFPSIREAGRKVRGKRKKGKVNEKNGESEVNDQKFPFNKEGR